MNSNVTVTGLREVIAGLRQAGDASHVEFELHAALLPITSSVRSRAAGLSQQMPATGQSRSKGGLAQGLRIVEGRNWVGVRETKPYGGAQEFGRHWPRRAHERKNRGGGTSEVRAHEVTMHSQATPRFLYRAGNEVAPDSAVERLIDAGLEQMFLALGFEVT